MLAPLNQGGDESPDVRQGYQLESAFGRHRESILALTQRTDRPRRYDILHECNRRADRVGDAERGNMFLDEILAFEMRNAGLLICVRDGRIDQMPHISGLRRVGGDDSLADFLLYTGLVAVAHQEHGV